MPQEIWQQLHNSQSGTAVVIANGPSLNDIPLHFLRKYPTFGTNNIFLKRELTVNYYVVTNVNVIIQSREEILKYPANYKFTKDRELPFIWYNLINKPRFSKDPTKGIHEGFTVTHVCLQLAYWIGFTTVLIVGLDHKYHDVGEPNKRARKKVEDTDHFTKDYFPPGTVWNYPDLKQSRTSYRAAQKEYLETGRQIINVSTFSECDVFPKVNWQHYA